MSRLEIEYKRFSTEWIDDIKKFFDKTWKKCLAECDIECMDYDDIQMLKEISSTVNSTLDASRDYIDVMNYQVKLLEDVTYKLNDIERRLEKIENKVH